MHELNDTRITPSFLVRSLESWTDLAANTGLLIMSSKKLRGMPIVVLLMIAMIGLQLGGCAEINPVYPIHDSGKQGVWISGWLDNNRVVFYSEQRAPATLGIQGPPPILDAGYYVWDATKGTINKDESLQDAAKVCIRENVITFLRKSNTDDKTWVVVTRENGQETVAPFVKTEWFNRFSCRYYEKKPDWIIQDHATLPLLDGHGFLDWSSEEDVHARQNRHIIFYQPNHSNGIKLPIRMRQVWRSEVVYAAFKNAYMFAPHSYIDPETLKEEPIGPWPKGMPVPMWWLAPDGTVTTEEVPYMPFMRGGSRGFYPTREGIFIYTHKTDDLGKPGDAGGYLVKGGTVQKLITGMVERVSISPDGCHIAFVHDPYDTIYGKDRLDQINVKVIDVCEEDGHVH